MFLVVEAYGSNCAGARMTRRGVVMVVAAAADALRRKTHVAKTMGWSQSAREERLKRKIKRKGKRTHFLRPTSSARSESEDLRWLRSQELLELDMMAAGCCMMDG